MAPAGAAAACGGLGRQIRCYVVTHLSIRASQSTGNTYSHTTMIFAETERTRDVVSFCVVVGTTTTNRPIYSSTTVTNADAATANLWQRQTNAQCGACCSAKNATRGGIYAVTK